MPNRILVLVLGALVPPYPALIRTIKRTWAARDVADIDVLFYYGGAELARHGRDLYLPVSDSYWSAGHKTLRAFDYALASVEFDLLFRTNCSSYVDLPNLRDYVHRSAEPERFYAGPAGRHSTVDDLTGVREDFHLAYGFGYLLSRDVVELIVNRQADWDHSLTDDFALGKLLTESGIPLVPMPHLVVDYISSARGIDTSQFLFRCKTDSSMRQGDVDIFLEIDEQFTRARGETLGRWYTPARRVKRRARLASRTFSDAVSSIATRRPR
jgi:hypothetical protein